MAPRAGAGGGATDEDLDPDRLSLVARIVTADEEVLDRAEFLVVSGERAEVTLRELLYESRVRFVRQCPRYSRWWAEGAARQRGEGEGVFGLGSGLEFEEPEEAPGNGVWGAGWHEEGRDDGGLLAQDDGVGRLLNFVSEGEP
ncbi:hypothetical protein GPECTOR_11g79 [Gonium pectorale]|uniref:Uncharacterized protein n=1 Tax=Gonium pectorale TaxID=33097 RepID=A0A150GQ63_GONPE|nr:hypothetical protein GPECTOR_11g79 [Gonium pectorale]|eukprot:KXZ51955.1 hypothetical protein GPECTOR_11g79 [Gonium pectorale]